QEILEVRRFRQVGKAAPVTRRGCARGGAIGPRFHRGREAGAQRRGRGKHVLGGRGGGGRLRFDGFCCCWHRVYLVMANGTVCQRIREILRLRQVPNHAVRRRILNTGRLRGRGGLGARQEG